MHVGNVDMLNEVFISGGATFAPLSSAMLQAVFGKRGTLDVAHSGYGDHHIVISDDVLVVELTLIRTDFGLALVSELLLDFLQLILDDAHLKVDIAEDSVYLIDESLQLCKFILKLLLLHPGKLAETDLHDGSCLDFSKIEP